MAFITSLSSASLDGLHSGLNADTLEHLQNPPTSQLLFEDDPDLKAAVKLYLKLSHAQVNYNSARKVIMERLGTTKFPSLHQAQQAVEHLSGVLSLMNDMCMNTCLTFTGPLAALKNCPQCGEARYQEDILQKSKGTKSVPRQQYPTIPLGPLFQKIFDELCENDRFLKQYSDFLDRSDYLNAVQEGKIADSDIVVMFSIDGAQLYQFKASDCWIAIWVIFDHSPKTHYKKKYVLPGCIIPGPKKPKNLDSFLFPGFYHLAALQKEGLKIWDASRNTIYISHPFLALGTADGPGLAYLNGLVSGYIYYPALQKPDNYDVAGCNHPDVDPHPYNQ
ncbi:hypothetical protein PAXRUDRAFT_18260 [Paxillus rubicundulus Ve08.2h10]|uniref:Uncharacterized protein n=1 Tax=Paxillus rubicundulus Ve08.2h10 TaxID=930991 RepID=A0A0D0DFC1_9AGAM|nr:hypothetical protein PAXRUDRAFT_18260 [Paxillus rubicundulus Ve08.2h10]